MNLPALDINVDELLVEVQRLLDLAREHKREIRGVNNWDRLSIAEVEYHKSMLRYPSKPYCAVIIDEAEPGSDLVPWLHARIDAKKFPYVYFECEE